MATVDLKQPLAESLKMWNIDKNLAWTLGTNYSNVGTQFETYVNNYLFPKLQETRIIEKELGNRFNGMAKEVADIAQLSEEYVIMDSVPVDLNLDREETLMFKRNYPKMATRLYGAGVHKKQKFTLNDNDNRLNWQTLGDAISYAVRVYRKRVSDINVSEESEIKAMLVDYALNQIADTNVRKVETIDELGNIIFESVLNLQNNSSKYNECQKASGGAVGRYTTVSDFSDLVILTTDSVKTYLLNTKIANTFQVAGLDLTGHVMSFDDLGGNFKVTADITLKEADVAYMRTMGDYQAQTGDIINSGVVFTYDISKAPSFTGKATEIKPTTKEWAFIFDKNALYYKRNTSKLLPTSFYNNELDEYTYWMHYYSFKAISPFYNKLVCEIEK